MTNRQSSYAHLQYALPALKFQADAPQPEQTPHGDFGKRTMQTHLLAFEFLYPLHLSFFLFLESAFPNALYAQEYF